MQLNKKQSSTPKTYNNAPKEYKKGTKVDWYLYKENPDAVIPYGKHTGKTLGYIIKYDEWYYNWLHAQSLMGDWGLIMKKQEDKKLPDYDTANWYITDSGQIWVGIRVIDAPCRASQWL